MREGYMSFITGAMTYGKEGTMSNKLNKTGRNKICIALNMFYNVGVVYMHIYIKIIYLCQYIGIEIFVNLKNAFGRNCPKTRN